MPGEMKIRAACPNDYDEIIKLFDSWAPNNWDTKFAARYYRKFFDNRHDCALDKVFVGLVQNKIVAVTGFCPDDYETADIYWLNWFYVHKDYKNHGYGRQLLDHVIKTLKTRKARKLYVDTTSYRFYTPASELYDKRGFIREGILKDYYGKGEHQIILGRNLN